MKLAHNVALLPISREGMGSLNLVLTWDDMNLVLIDAGLTYGQAVPRQAI